MVFIIGVQLKIQRLYSDSIKLVLIRPDFLFFYLEQIIVAILIAEHSIFSSTIF